MNANTITDELSLKERSNLIFLDRCLHEHWGLGENVILNWCPEGDGIALLVIPPIGVVVTLRLSGCPDSMRDMSGSGPCSPILNGVWQSLQPAVETR